MAKTFSYVKHGAKLIEVRKNGEFAGWLSADARRATGLHTPRYIIWSGKIDGCDVRANTITAAKQKIEAARVAA